MNKSNDENTIVVEGGFFKSELLLPLAEESYLNVAKKLHSGAMFLLNHNSGEDLSFSILAAQSLECALKGYLSHKGYDIKALKKKNNSQNKGGNKEFNHNLVALWNECKKNSLPLPEAPNWCISLDEGHSYPYYFRYAENVHGIGFPNPEDVKNGLSSVLEVIQGAIECA